jgi:hypothetical protein
MIAATDTTQLSAAQKAQIIYTQARSELTSRLWRAALGTDDDRAKPLEGERSLPMSLEALLSLLEEQEAAPTPPVRQEPEARPREPDGVSPGCVSPPSVADGKASGAYRWDGHGGTQASGGRGGYGPNAGYAPILSAAAQRAGVPSTALASIVHAEAAKGPDGRWLPYSRNPRSSAAGLGQFLSGTWRGEAEREGTWLNQMARQRGWLNGDGKVEGAHRADLLALRYDPEAAIQATADYAKDNLDALRRAGVTIGETAQAIAQAAYLGHHLGRGDAIRFLRDGLDPDRARVLLNAQVGAGNASRRIAESGNAATAHRAWLLDYVGRNIRPDRFRA